MPVFSRITWLLFQTSAAMGLLPLLGADAPATRRPPSPIERAQGFRNDSVIAMPATGAENTAQLSQFALAETLGLKVRRPARNRGPISYAISDGSSPETVISRLRKDPSFRFVEPNYLVRLTSAPNDPHFEKQSSVREYSNSNPQGRQISVHAEMAWNTARSARDVVVAIIDSGIRATHEDLVDNLWTNPHANNPHHVLGNGRHGFNATVHAADPASGVPEDDIGHGTKIAGIIGAKGNNFCGVVGIAWDIRLMALKAFPLGDATQTESGEVYGDMDDILACLDYAIAHGANIINASYGQSYFCQAEFEKIREARARGIVIVASASKVATQNHDAIPHYPACYPLDNVVAVANVSPKGDLFAFGSGTIELAAPGVGIFSTSFASDASYDDRWNGTSFSAPHVSGALALLTQQMQSPGFSYRDRVNRLLRSVETSEGSYAGKLITGGVLNIGRAVTGHDIRPFHDDFEKRQLLVGAHVMTRTANARATREGSEPSHNLNHTVWWEWKAPIDGNFLLSAEGSEGRVALAAYSGESLSTLGDNLAKRIEPQGHAWSLEAKQGTCYQIVAGTEIGPTGMVILTLSLPPNNDGMKSPTKIDSRADGSISWPGQNRLATRESDEPRSDIASSGRSVWASWIATKTGCHQLKISSTQFAAVLSICAVDETGRWKEITSTSSVGTKPGSTSFETKANQAYLLRVDSLNQGTGEFLVSGNPE